MSASEQKHEAFIQAVDYYTTLFPNEINEILEGEMRAELTAAQASRLSDAPYGPADRALVKDIRWVIGPRDRLPTISPEEMDNAVRGDARRVRSTLVASWLEVIRSACERSSDFVRLDQSLLPPYLPDDGGEGEGNWRTGIVSRPSVYVLRREPAGRVFDAFIAQIRTKLDEKDELPLFAFPRSKLKKTSSNFLILFE